MLMRRIVSVLVAASLMPGLSVAGEGEDQANAFARIYSSLCLKHLTNLDALREKLAPLPRLPPENARLFLGGLPGDAWPVPDKHGTFVLVLPHGKSFCAIHVRRADTELAGKLFASLVGTAPPPLVAKQVRKEQGQTAANGQTSTVAYEWSIASAPSAMLFTLTTAASPTANLQVLASAAVVGR
jgi:hypothetical protein